MNYLSLNVPGLNGGTAGISAPPNFKADQFTNLGSVVSGGLNLAFMIGGFLMLFWFSWGVFQYLFAGGNKENLAKARARLTWAIMGFVFLTISFAISQYAQKIVPTENSITPVSIPGNRKCPPGDWYFDRATNSCKK